ncbi:MULTISPECIES: SIR2 family protein [unclassified Halomonas]|uniref:SIR2 family NAD-dependent protein deacylase n=1 Tax=unclassified Halomonas TaxID=2609666 RepID=UPI001EF47F99|nr:MULTISPECIES: SIR2 family protein [unclassified Halomonas]MCG7591897.1 SIR2 family protein [Halomonas sp. McD50-5]MCG7617900.1 SIR2 family protein [Halomonas sp. McD50-4]
MKFVAELAISNSDLFQVQRSIADLFENVQPAEFHKKISLFRWRAIFTTNYDTIIEDAYRLSDAANQRCEVILSNKDGLDEVTRNAKVVPFFKLHGCITRARDENLPLILTTDQYNQYLENRDRLFSYLYELGHENTIIFAGYSNQDSNIRYSVERIEKSVGAGRPKYYIVKPGMKEIEKDLWASKRISAIDTTLEGFINELEISVSDVEKALSAARPVGNHPIQARFVTNSTLKDDIRDALEHELVFVTNSISDSGEVNKFYAGANQGWFPICNGLDCARTLTDVIVNEVITCGEGERKSPVEFFVIKGEAGSGKSVELRRLAWNASLQHSRLCLYVNSLCQPKPEVIEEISALSEERVFLFWDNAGNNITGLLRLLKQAEHRKIKLTVFTAERYTEWNTKCSSLSGFVTREYKLNYLGRKEAECLVDLLEKHNCLGPALNPLTRDQRIERFMDVLDRQLLVALHEATMGRPFEDIIVDEYESLNPQSAKDLYRIICLLNRFRIPVRAGLISRVTGITFESFSNNLFKPLEKVVITNRSPGGDVYYTARHAEIAEIVFDRAYETVEDRYYEYVRILQSLNISFGSDRQSFRRMIRAKSLIELFSDHHYIENIYTIALESGGREPYLLQQMANYERIRSNGNFKKAISLLNEAAELAPRDESILHTLAVVWKAISENSIESSEKDRCRQEARSILNALVRVNGHTQAIDNVLINIELSVLQEHFKDGRTTEFVIDNAIRNVEKLITDCKKRYPLDDGFLALEASFATMINDEPRALRALKSAYEKDSKDTFIAIRLAGIYEKNSEIDEAAKVLQDTLASKRHDQRLNFSLAELLRKKGGSSDEDLAFYYRRSFTPGDKNYQAQFWYARFTLESDKPELRRMAKEIFESLSSARLSFEAKTLVRDYIEKDGKVTILKGRLVFRNSSYGSVQPDNFSSEAFVNEESVDDEMWEALMTGDELRFKLGFNYMGLICKEVVVL